ncbi:Nickel/cobalt efflux system [Tolypocladium capitatum]|uniref:Nickel/cobalt efflux system n=1 Tax=Tolypocladium capitatum TaxID=45235 RepID=A0A2K3QQH1_9HYPO|nr:Nickel/cobalt efflux system [Tolypocladium capitatum]
MKRLKLPPKPKLLSGIPSNSIAIIALLITVNALVWASVAVVLRFHPALISPAALSYTLGLRHALDADHISAIDLVTRRLIASGQRPATVGTFFSLGHSTIVIVTCIVVAATSGALRERFVGFKRVGNIVGTAVSATILIILSMGNAWVLYKLVKQLQAALAEQRRVAGMCLLDTTDGALMMALYTSTAFSRDVVAILYYSIVLTGITIFVSAFIGIVQVLSLVQNVAEPEGSFWDGVSAIGDHFDIIGGSICGMFVVVGLGSILVYRPWRRRMDRRRQGLTAEEESSLQYEGLASPPSQDGPPRCFDT